ncbi:cellulose-binding protein [Amycolatopsis pithecellobii]|uniref:Cellulose-binding protein n=1 Tax=Amycolatopsis pithecellobii TaxID=664692 RepID=A0A6N7YWH9_9PSEU|nr:cellulose-binding protein [Amycolatopsis pithecellobii]MTD52689.1 cellulose-binding protein [Amycolatopsis pithecellobii]
MYSARQVREYVRRIEAELEMVIADRDAAVASAENLARRLEELRSENDRLHAKIDRISRSPIEADGLSDRLFRMIELAQEESTEITERARAAAERSWAATERAAQRLRERHLAVVAEADAQRRAVAEDHQRQLERTRTEIAALSEQAAKERQKLDEEAAQRRQEVEKDFDEAMRARRAAAVAEIEAQVQEAAQERARLLAETQERARKLLDHAQGQAGTVEAQRNRTIAELHAIQKLLAEATPMLQVEPPDGAVPAPRKEPANAQS